MVADLEASWLFMAANYPDLAARAHGLARRRLAEAPLMGAAGRARLGVIAFLLCAQGREAVSVTSPLARRALDAGRLFTTLKTVEKHLANAFRKLGTHSRRDLPPLG